MPALIEASRRNWFALATAAAAGLHECAALLRSRAQALWRSGAQAPAKRRR